ncbi:hypothetical protein PG999_008349 [Apiospora kogelbergensis]|uniref:DUF7708 domain-containing protein n=1 Tax=Apiospora kogelbergensis TaxID=1337665 RepID=A0AAW0QG50_9PEZI
MAAHETALQAAELRPSIWKDWLRFETPEPDPTVEPLQFEAKAASELWRSLKLDIRDFGGSGNQIPSVQTLRTAVHGAQAQWNKKSESGFGKAKTQFFSFLETMDSHKYLFSVIPNGDKYTSLITGIITSVVKASVNHQKLADGFSRALQEISRDINFVRRGTKLCDTAEMRTLVVELYKEVFAFLCYSMKWYSSSRHRLRKAFDNHFYDKNVEQRVQSCQDLVQRVRDEMSLQNDRLVQDMHSGQRTGFDEIVNRISKVEDNLSAKFEDNLNAKFQMLTEIVGLKMFGTLQANAQHDLNPDQPRITELAEYLPVLAPFVTLSPRDDASRIIGNAPTIPNEVAVDIQRWLQAPESGVLWVEGPAYGPFEDVLASIGARIQSSAEEVEISCVSFFAKTKYPFEAQVGSMKNAGLISMAYSIISQLIHIAPSSLPYTPDLAESKMRQLDGRLDTMSASLDILRTLISHLDPGLVVVICGFHLVDSRENVAQLSRFVEILRDQAPERRVKTLFLSAGNCRALAGSIDRSNRSDASRLTLARPQLHLPGGSSVNSIRLGR